jgi:hypothetical protein
MFQLEGPRGGKINCGPNSQFLPRAFAVVRTKPQHLRIHLRQRYVCLRNFDGCVLVTAAVSTSFSMFSITTTILESQSRLDQHGDSGLLAVKVPRGVRYPGFQQIENLDPRQTLT